jgi:hypothetical protein
VLMSLGESEHEWPLACLTSPVNPDNIMPPPACRRMLKPFPRLMGKRCLMLVERLAKTIGQGGRHQSTHRHHHAQRHEALRLFPVPRGGYNRRGFKTPTPTFRTPWALIPFQKRWRWPWGFGPCVGGQDDTTVLVDERLWGRERGGPGPVDVGDDLVGVGAWPRSSAFAIAGRRVHRAGGQAGGRQALRNGRKRLLRLHCTRNRVAASCLPGLDCVVTLLAPLLVHRTLGLRRAGLGVQEAPAWLEPARARRQRVSALARSQRRHGLWIGLDEGRLRLMPGRRAAGDPLPGAMGTRLEVVRAREGTISHQGGRPIRGVQRLAVSPAYLTTRVGLAAVATARCQQAGEPRLLRHHQRHHDWGESRAMITAVAPGDVHALFRGLLVAGVAPIALNARPVEGRRGGTKAQTLGGGHRDEAVACRAPLGLEDIQGPPTGIIVEWGGDHAGGQETGGGLMREEPRDQRACLMDPPHAIEHHRLDRLPHGAVSPFRGVVRGVINDIPTAEFVDHAGAQAEVVQDLATGRGLVGHHHLLCW